MINYESILSSYDDKLTLMQWLKKVEAALAASVLTAVNVTQDGDIVTLSFDFEDGTKIETPAIRVNQQITGAQVVNGELVFTLSNGQTINAGNLLDGNPLIIPAVNVNFNGNATIEGFLTAEAGVSTPSLTCDGSQINAQKPVVELMNGYSFATDYVSGTTYDIGVTYAGAVKNGNKLTLSLAFTIKRKSDNIDNYFPVVGKFTIPSSIFNRLVPDVDNLVDAKRVILLTGATDTSPVSLVMSSVKYTGKIHMQLGRPYQIPLNSVFYSRYEVTFLLSDNMAA